MYNNHEINGMFLRIKHRKMLEYLQHKNYFSQPHEHKIEVLLTSGNSKTIQILFLLGRHTVTLSNIQWKSLELRKINNNNSIATPTVASFL